MVIDDCYNANPVSMKASLEVLQDALGRKVALLGDMGELGKNEVEMHREVGRFAAEKDIDVIVCTGTLCKEMAEAAKEVSNGKKVLYFENREALEDALDELILKQGNNNKALVLIHDGTGTISPYNQVIPFLHSTEGSLLALQCNDMEEYLSVKPEKLIQFLGEEEEDY